MFHWRVGDHEVVLTDEEELSLLERAGFSASERIGFLIATVRGEELQRRLGDFLEQYYSRDPRQFELEFVQRGGTGPEHLPELHALVDAYQRTCGRVRWGDPPVRDWPQEVGPALWPGGRSHLVSLTLLAPVRQWFRRTWDVVGEVSFPSAEIERFYGNGSSFFIATSRLNIRGGEGYVQILQLPDDESDRMFPRGA